MEYFNGKKEVNVSNIDSLKDMTQDIANAIATGPQDTFFEKLDGFNEQLNYYNIESIDVTDKWNWKPGTYPKIDKYLHKQLYLDKSSAGILKRFERTRERANYLNYVIQQARMLETLKSNLKNSGLTKDVDIDEFKEKASVLVNQIEEQCELAEKATNGKVIIKPFITTEFQHRMAPIYLGITLKDLTMSIHYEGKCIQKILLSPINIILQYPLRHYINKFSTNWSLLGFYGYDYKNAMFRFPYIAAPYLGYRATRYEYGTVCLDRYNVNVKKSFLSIDYVTMAMELMAWAQYYNTAHSNPYNNLKFLHLGIPGEYSKEYRAVISNVPSDCASRIRQNAPITTTFYDKASILVDPCNQINCQLKETCTFNKRNNRYLEEMDNPGDNYFMMESIIGYVDEYYKEHTIISVADHLSNSGFGNYSFESFDLIESLIEEYFDMDGKLDYWVNNLISYYGYEDNSKPNTDIVSAKEEGILSDEEVQKMMLEWATNPERSR